MTVTTTASARYLFFTLTEPQRIPEALLAQLRDEVVLAGFLRANGVLSDVTINTGASGKAARHIEGRVHVVALEGSIGLTEGDITCGMRAVLSVSRTNEAGDDVVETLAGEIVDAKVESLDVFVTAFDDITAARRLHPAGCWMFEPQALPQAKATPAERVSVRIAEVPRVTMPAPEARLTSRTVSSPLASEIPSRSEASARPVASGFGDFVRASESEAPRGSSPQPRPSPTFSASNPSMPVRIARPAAVETEDDPVPEPGDTVEHFAFGRCEVVKTEGDRLHVRLEKDQRIKEIALEMLKVSTLPAADGQSSRHWKLARKL